MNNAFVIVDLDDFLTGGEEGRTRQIQIVKQAIERKCFVRVKGHGFTHEGIDYAYEVVRRLFALGVEVLNKYVVPGNQVGYIGFGKEKADGAIYPDRKEFWQVYQPDQAETQTAKFYNIWPTDEVPEFEGVALDLFYRLQRVTQGMLRLTALAIGLPEEHFAEGTVGGSSIARIIHYPPVPDGAVGIRSEKHTDINHGTGLLTSQGGGLQLLDHSTGEWLPVEHDYDHIVFNWADMIQAATNGQVPSVMHRVVNPDDPELRSKPRFSIVFFLHPREEIVLEESSDIVKDSGPLTAHMFLWLRLWQIWLSDTRPAWYTGPDRAPQAIAV